MATNGSVRNNPLNKPSHSPGLPSVRLSILRARRFLARSRNRSIAPEPVVRNYTDACHFSCANGGSGSPLLNSWTRFYGL